MFYVYEYYKVDNDEVFYVGKGTGRRYLEVHNRNKYFNAVYSKYDCDVRIIKGDLTNEEACALEIDMIKYYKSRNQAYCNFTNGGTGFSTGQLNPIHKRIREGRAKLFDENSRFYGENNGFYGRQHSDETKLLMSMNRKGKGGQFGPDNPMYGSDRFRGINNPMYGVSRFDHPNSRKFKIIYLDGDVEYMTYKECEKKFGIAFSRIEDNGTLHYKKKSKNDIYEGTYIERVTTSREA